jgi:hypothetical protein
MGPEVPLHPVAPSVMQSIGSGSPAAQSHNWNRMSLQMKGSIPEDKRGWIAIGIAIVSLILGLIALFSQSR